VLILVTIEGKRFDVGSKLSIEVNRIVPYVVDWVLEEAHQQIRSG
jgi:hypothetical protein